MRVRAAAMGSMMAGLTLLATDASANPACDAPGIEIEGASAQVQDWGRAVGRLRQKNGGGYCTATLISPNLAITAGHCFDPADNTVVPGNTPQAICDQTAMQFGYQLQGGEVATGSNFDCVKVHDKLFEPFPDPDAIDVAIIELAGNPGHEFGYRPLNYGYDFTAGQTLTLIGHPNAQPKQVATTTSYSATSVMGVPILTHYADTEGGSSGGAILDEDGFVVGIHVSVLSDNQCKKHAYPLERYDLIDDEDEDDGNPDVFAAMEKVTWIQRDPSTGGAVGDHFGAAMATGDLDGDGADELIVHRASGPNGMAGAGALSVYWGTDDFGLDTKDVTEFGQQLASSPEVDDLFGSVLATGDFNDDGYDDLVIATPDEDWGPIADHGVVQVISGGPAGISSSSPQEALLPQQWGIDGEIDMRFGASLAVGDFDCDGFDDLAIGAPGADGDMGRVFIANGFDSPQGIPADGETFDAVDLGTYGGGASPSFGYALAAGHLTGAPPTWSSGCVDLAIAAPTDDAGGVSGAGAVSVVAGDSAGLAGSTTEVLMAAAPQTFGFYGWSLAAGPMFDMWGDYDAIAIGSPLDSEYGPGAGRVDVRRGYYYGVDAYTWGLLHASAAGVGLGSLDTYGRAVAFAGVDMRGEEGDADNWPLFATASGNDTHATGAGVLVGTPAWGGGSMGQPVEVGPLGLSLSSGDGFGNALVGGDFDGDGEQELAIGIPDVDRVGTPGVGGVLVRSLMFCSTMDGTCP